MAKVRPLMLLVSTAFLLMTLGVEGALNATEIKCRLCAEVVSHVWQTGEALRRSCEKEPRDDRLCDGRFVRPDAIVHLVETTCDYLPVTHHGSISASHQVPAFELTRRRHHPRWRGMLDQDSNIHVDGPLATPTVSHPGDQPFLGEEDSATLRAVCVRWIHERHTTDKIAAVVFSNLQAGRTEGDIMRYLRRRFCFPACGSGSRRPLKKPRWDDEL